MTKPPKQKQYVSQAWCLGQHGYATTNCRRTDTPTPHAATASALLRSFSHAVSANRNNSYSEMMLRPNLNDICPSHDYVLLAILHYV